MQSNPINRVNAKKCKVCATEFNPQRMGQAVCSPVCARDSALLVAR